MSAEQSGARVSALYVYPLKSARGVAVESIELDERGPVGDRRWMLVDDDAVFISLREAPKLAFLEAQFTTDGLRLSAPGHEPLDVSRPRNGSGDRFAASLWDDACEVVAAAPGADAWLSDFLGARCRLVYQPDDAVLPLPRRNAGRITQPRRIALTDGAPLLLTSEASLDDLNVRLPSPVPMSRFRPNVVVRGAQAYDEDTWRRIVIGEVTFESPRACPRCVATTVDQASGLKGIEPLRTLAQYRRGAEGTLFGLNITHEQPGMLRIGDPVQVLERGRSQVDAFASGTKECCGPSVSTASRGSEG